MLKTFLVFYHVFFSIYIFQILVLSCESLIATNITKWSEIEVSIIPFLRDVSNTQFVKILCISFALDVVTLVGLSISISSFLVHVFEKLSNLKTLIKF